MPFNARRLSFPVALRLVLVITHFLALYHTLSYSSLSLTLAHTISFFRRPTPLSHSPHLHRVHRGSWTCVRAHLYWRKKIIILYSMRGFTFEYCNITFSCTREYKNIQHQTDVRQPVQLRHLFLNECGCRKSRRLASKLKSAKTRIRKRYSRARVEKVSPKYRWT